MPIILKRLLTAVVETRWWVLAFFTGLHLFIAWAVLAALGEAALTNSDFFYYYLTTVTTVGYGDLSPQTLGGKWFAGLWLMAGGIALFTTVLAKIIGMVSGFWRLRLEGYGNYEKVTDATVIIGHEPGRTEKLIAELQADGNDDAPVIVVTVKEAKLPEGVRLVRAARLTDTNALVRAGIKNAARVVVFADNDDLSLSACLAASSLNPDTHMVAYFNDGDTAALARAHCKALETVSANAEELVMRATRDPGASAVLSALVSAADEDGAMFSVQADALGAPLSVTEAQNKLRADRATLMAIQGADGTPRLCMAGDDVIDVGMRVFYVARRRLAG